MRRNFDILTSFFAMSGRCIIQGMAVPWYRDLDSGSPLLYLYHLSPSSTAVVSGASQVPFLHLGVCEGSGLSAIGRQHVGKGCFVDIPSLGYYSRLLLVHTIPVV